MLRKLFDFLVNLGVTTGPTFRVEPEDGVGVFLVPNPTPNRVNPQAVPMPRARRVDGNWTARRVHVTDRFPFLQ